MNPPPPNFAKFMDVFVWFYVFFGVALVVAILNVFCGLFLLRKKAPDVFDHHRRAELLAYSLRHDFGRVYDHRPIARIGAAALRG